MSILQALDTTPRQIARVFGGNFTTYLPGWSVTGEYNFQIGSSTQMGAAQLEALMQSGNHKWINDAVADLFGHPDWVAAENIPGRRTQMMAAMVQFMSEASGPEALASGGARTGNYIAFSSLSDPHLIAKLGYPPNGAQMAAITKQGISWSNILNSDVGKAVLALNVRKVLGSDGVERLQYDGKTGKTGFFSRSLQDLLTQPWTKPGSTRFSQIYALKNKITKGKHGAILKDGVEIRKAEAKALLATKTLTRGALPISTFAKAPSKLLKRIPLLSLGALALLAPTAASAQTGEGYTPVVAVPANKAFIEEFFAISTGGIAGLVAGALAGAATLGLLAIPVGIAAGVAGEAAGRLIGTFFYNNFTAEANAIAEWLAPILAPVGEGLVAIGDVIEDVAGKIFGAVTDAFEYVGDLVSGVDGLFGLNGPLFGPSGPLHALVETGKKEKFLTTEGTWVYDGFDSILYGTDGDDILIHDEGLGAVYGGKGDDVLVGVSPEFASAGSPLFDDEPDFLATEDTALLLDGGEGNDWVVTVFGEEVPKNEDGTKKDGTVTAGGLGRDWIFNTSPSGIIWGDVAGSVEDISTGNWFYYETRTNADGEEEEVRVDIADDKTNADNIWFWADTTLMDAGHADYLKYLGIPLTGGDANGGIAGYALNGFFGAAVGLGNLTRYFTGEAQDWQDEIYIDHLQPWMIYGFKEDEDGNLDMYISNVFEGIFRGMLAAIAGESQPEGIEDRKGWMVIENVDVVGSRLGALQKEADDLFLSNGKQGGSLNMVFRAVNPLQVLAPLVKEFVPGLIGGALYYGVMADSLLSTFAALERFAESLKWSDPEDPLVIDLDGDGIETVGLDTTRAYFDIDEDMFRERTAWLKGDDGFLVVDSNGNGRIDNIAEMFGGRGLSGFGELATHDSDGDGRITAADLIWADLQVWQDRDRDGETDAGELKSLSTLGIIELNLTRTTLNAATAQGVQLLARGDVRFAGGRANPKVTQKLHQGIPEKRRSGQMSRCAAAACNDNDAWPGRPFIECYADAV